MQSAMIDNKMHNAKYKHHRHKSSYSPGRLAQFKQRHPVELITTGFKDVKTFNETSAMHSMKTEQNT